MGRSLMRYDADVGFTYMPSTKIRVQGMGGGYLVRTNTSGFRSDREFTKERATGSFRVLLFGDSQSAGDGMVNALRYSDLLEQKVLGLEVQNYAVSGTGTDQHYLTYLQQRSVEHDLVVIGLYAENIRRVSRRILMSADANGDVTYRSKPYFTLDGERLELCNVPVPKQTWSEETLGDEQRIHVLRFGDEYAALKGAPQWLAGLPGRLSPDGSARQLARAVRQRFSGGRMHPLPEYDRADNDEWQLLRAILMAWIARSSVPLVILLLPHETALTGVSDPTNYQQRFAELSRDAGCEVVDVLPRLASNDTQPSRFWSASSGHLSEAGHEAIADLLVPLVRARMPRPPERAPGQTT